MAVSLILFRHHLSPATIGLAISQVILLFSTRPAPVSHDVRQVVASSNILNWCIRYIAEAQMNFTSVERILHYLEIDQVSKQWRPNFLFVTQDVVLATVGGGIEEEYGEFSKVLALQRSS